MKIVITAKCNDWDSKIDPRFGRTNGFAIYDDQKDELEFLDNHELTEVSHGAGPKAAQKILGIDANIIITGNGPGEKSIQILKRKNTKIYCCPATFTIKEAVEAYKQNKLELFNF